MGRNYEAQRAEDMEVITRVIAAFFVANKKYHFADNLRRVTERDCVREFFIIKRLLRTSTMCKYLIRSRSFLQRYTL